MIVTRHAAKEGGYCLQYVVWGVVKEYGLEIFKQPAKRVRELILVGNIVNSRENIKAKMDSSQSIPSMSPKYGGVPGSSIVPTRSH